tara:strand:+ start:40 stop:579 length:540 start_codon:yes stop_codon:yes gene_type:complete
MAVLGVDDFKAKIRGGGARPNLFQATINFPTYAGSSDITETASFLCEAAQLPGSTMGTIILPFRGRQLKMAGDRTFETWTATIINDTDFKIRNAIETWMSGIGGHSENVGRTNPVEYEADLRIAQLDRTGSKIKEYIFNGAHPVDLTAITVSYGLSDEIERFDVTFQYQYWTTVDGTAV